MCNESASNELKIKINFSGNELIDQYCVSGLVTGNNIVCPGAAFNKIERNVV